MGVSVVRAGCGLNRGCDVGDAINPSDPIDGYYNLDSSSKRIGDALASESDRGRVRSLQI